jgi:hypothetical protein
MRYFYFHFNAIFHSSFSSSNQFVNFSDYGLIDEDMNENEEKKNVIHDKIMSKLYFNFMIDEDIV